MWKKSKAYGALLIVASIILLTGCGPKEETTVAEEREIPVEVANVTYGVLTDSNQLTGTIEAKNEVAILPKAAGEITKISVKKGSMVKKGDVIAQLDNSAEQNAVEQQNTALKSAQNAKTRAQSSYEQSKLSLETAKKALEQAQQSQEDSIKNTDIQVQNAERNWETAKKNLERLEVLYDSGLVSQQEYESAVTNEHSAKNALEQAKLTSEQAGRETNFISQEAQIAQAEINLEIAKSSLTDADIAVTQAQLAVDLAKERLDDKVVKATISGEVTNVSAEVGEMASSANAIATITSTDMVKLNVNIPSTLLPTFTIGDEVNVEVSGLEGTFKGKVAYISTVSSGYGLFTVEIEMNNAEKQIRPGMIASVIIEEVKEENSLMVPADAVIQKEGKSAVFIVVDGKAVMKEVEVGLSNVEFTSIIGDLKENDQVVISGQNLLEDGNLVKIMEED